MKLLFITVHAVIKTTHGDHDECIFITQILNKATEKRSLSFMEIIKFRQCNDNHGLIYAKDIAR